MQSAFTDWINRELSYMDAIELAEKLGVEPSQIYRWRDGKQPYFDNAQKIIEKLGGNLSAAFPGRGGTFVDIMKETPGPEYGQPAARLLGQVQAGEFSPAGDSTKMLPVDLRQWGNRVERMGIVEVVGDSMMPRYSPGQYLICMKVDSHDGIADGTPCIFLEHGNTTFKLLRWLDGKPAVAQPINCEHKLIALHGRSVRVQMVVVGSIELSHR